MNTTIGKFFNTIGIVLLSILFSLSYLINEIKNANDKLTQIQDNRYNTRLTADMLRQSSDDLTRLARQYVVTGNENFKKDFNTVLYIRNGEFPLPKNYQNIYWDLLEPLRLKTHPNEKKISLESLIKNLDYDKYELEKLKEAQQNSDDLVNIEIEAFNAVIGLFKDDKGNYTIYDKPNRQKAITLLHSLEYLKAKEKIMLPIDQFLEHLDYRTSKEVLIYKNKIKNLKIFIDLLSFIFVSVFLAAVIMIRKKILNPINYLTLAINSFRLKKDISKKSFYQDEIGFMTEEFFKMKNEIEEDIKLIGKNKRNMEEYLKLVDQNIITSSTDLNGKIIYASEAFAQISGYSKEELIGKNHRIARHPDMPEKIYKELWETILQDKKWTGELKNKTKNGGYYWVDATIYPNYDEKGIKTGYTAIRVDITPKKRVEELLEQSKQNEKKIQQYIKLVDKNIITSSTDINGKITEASEAFAKISGYTKEELIGKNHRIVKHEENDPIIYDQMWETISNNRVWHGILKNRKKDGGSYWVDATLYPTFDEYGEKTGYTAIRIDITDKKKIEQLLITDALTDIYNRRYFNEMMPKAINIAKRDKKYFSFIIMDIDHFKQYNDTYGHQEGDDVLIKVASTVKKSLQRASDMCFRLGGEEFAVIFESLNPKEAYEFSDKIRKNIENLKIEHKLNSASPYVTVSMGLVTKKTLSDLDTDKIYKEADDLLYKAKQTGRNKIEADEV